MPRRLARARRPISASLFTIHTTSVGRLPGRQLVALFCGLALAAANGGALAQDPPAADPLTDDPPAAEGNGDVTLDDLAEIASMSPYYFARSFKAAVGLPPHQYVVRRRIDRAMRLLAATDLTIAHIAFDCGFASQAHMTTVFKRLTGTTPHRYRRSINA